MKKIIFSIISIFLFVMFANGCDIFDDIDKSIEDITKPKVSCTTTKQYRDKYGYSYYIEGKCVNNGSKDYDYLQVEYICYDKEGNNLGTALDNTNNLLAGQSWKFKAISLVSNAKSIDHCDFHEVSGW